MSVFLTYQSECIGHCQSVEQYIIICPQINNDLTYNQKNLQTYEGEKDVLRLTPLYFYLLCKISCNDYDFDMR